MLKVTGQLFIVDEKDVERLKNGDPIAYGHRPGDIEVMSDGRTFLHCCRPRHRTRMEEADEDHAVDFVLSALLKDERLELHARITKTHVYQVVDDPPADVREELRELKQILAFCQAQPDMLTPEDIPSHLSAAVILHVWQFIGALLCAWFPEAGRDSAIGLALRCSKLWPAETTAAASTDSLKICGMYRSVAHFLLDDTAWLVGRGGTAESRAEEAGRVAVQLLETAVHRLKSMSLTGNAAFNDELVLAASLLLRTERLSSAISTSTGDLLQMLRDGVVRSIEMHGKDTPGEVVAKALYHLNLKWETATTLSVCETLRKAHWFDERKKRYSAWVLTYEAIAHEKSRNTDLARQTYKEALAASLATLKKAQENTENDTISRFEFQVVLAKIENQRRDSLNGGHFDPTRAKEDGMIESQLEENLEWAVLALAHFGTVGMTVPGNKDDDVVKEMQALAEEYLGPFFDLIERHSSRGVASITLVRSVLNGLDLAGLGRGGANSIACVAKQIAEFAWERFDSGEEEVDPVVALTLNFIEAEAKESTTTLTTNERRAAWNGVVYEYLRAARAAGQTAWLGFHRQNWDILARAAEAAWIGGLDTEKVAGDLLVAKRVIDMHRRALRATLPPGADPEGPGLGLGGLPRGNSGSAVAEDVDVNELGKKALAELCETVKKDGVEYLEYLATPRMILRLHISRTDQPEVYAVAEDEKRVQELLTDYYNHRETGVTATAIARKLLPSKDKLSSSSRYVIAGSGFLHDLNFHNLFDALMEGNPPPVCQVLSGPSYVALSKHAKTKRAHQPDHLLWRYWPTDPNDPKAAEAERLVKLANDVADAFKAAPPQNPSQGEAGVLEYDAATLCLHGRFAWPMLSAELLTAPGRWVGAREFGQHGKIPLTDSVALDLQCLRRLMIIGCVAGRVERGVGAESIGLVRALFDHRVSCVIASLVPILPRGIFFDFVKNLVDLLTKGEAPALAVWRSWRAVRGNIEPGSSANWPVVWGRGFDPW